MADRTVSTKSRRRVLNRLTEGWQIVGHFLVDPNSDRPLETRRGVPRMVIKALAVRGFIKRIEGSFGPSYELSEAGRAVLLAYEIDEGDT
jgi:hypothetical protein